MRPLGGRFGASWGLFLASWGPLGASWWPLGGILGPLGGLLGPSGRILGWGARFFGSRSPFWAPCWACVWKPSLLLLLILSAAPFGPNLLRYWMLGFLAVRRRNPHHRQVTFPLPTDSSGRIGPLVLSSHSQVISLLLKLSYRRISLCVPPFNPDGRTDAPGTAQTHRLGTRRQAFCWCKRDWTP